MLIKNLNLFWITGLEIEYVLWKPWYRISIFTDHQRSCGKVDLMFSVVSTCQSFCLQWGPMLLLPMMNWNPPYTESLPQVPPLDMGCHNTGNPGPRPWTWNFTVQWPSDPTPASDIYWSRLKIYGNLFTWEPALLVTSGGQDWKLVQTCSRGDTPSNLCWHLVAPESCAAGEHSTGMLSCFSGAL